MLPLTTRRIRRFRCLAGSSHHLVHHQFSRIAPGGDSSGRAVILLWRFDPVKAQAREIDLAARLWYSSASAMLLLSTLNLRAQ